MKSLDVHESTNWWLYYLTLLYMLRRTIKQPSGSYIKNIHMTILQKIVFYLKRRAQKSQNLKLGFRNIVLRVSIQL
jgi:hypothetical protein